MGKRLSFLVAGLGGATMILASDSCTIPATTLTTSVEDIENDHERLRQSALYFLANEYAKGDPQKENLLVELNDLDLTRTSDSIRAIELYRLLLSPLDPETLTLENEFFEGTPSVLQARLDQIEIYGAYHPGAISIANRFDDLGKHLLLLGRYDVDPTESSITRLEGRFPAAGIDAAYERKASSARTRWETTTPQIQKDREKNSSPDADNETLEARAKSRHLRALAERGRQAVKSISYVPLRPDAVRFSAPLAIPGPGHDKTDASFFTDPWTSYRLVSTTFAELSPFKVQDSTGKTSVRIKHAYALSSTSSRIESDSSNQVIMIDDDEAGVVSLRTATDWFHTMKPNGGKNNNERFLYARSIAAPDGKKLEDMVSVTLPSTTPTPPYFKGALVTKNKASSRSVYNLPQFASSNTVQRGDSLYVWFPAVNLPRRGNRHEAVVSYRFVPTTKKEGTVTIDPESVKPYLNEEPPAIKPSEGRRETPHGQRIRSPYPNTYQVGCVVVPSNVSSHTTYDLLIAVRGENNKLISTASVDRIYIK